jgi:hypothetical protein
MPLYTVIWEIDIDAKTPKEAARKALTIQRDSNSTATVFSVSNQKGTIHTVDLEEIKPI